MDLALMIFAVLFEAVVRSHPVQMGRVWWRRSNGLPEEELAFDLFDKARAGDVAGLQVALDQSANRHDQADIAVALSAAAREGHVACVNLLLPHAQPTENHSAALQAAADHGHEGCVRALWSASDPKAAFHDALKKERWRAVDRMAEAVGTSQWKRAVSMAPPNSLPGIRARLEAQVLRAATDATIRNADRARPRL